MIVRTLSDVLSILEPLDSGIWMAVDLALEHHALAHHRASVVQRLQFSSSSSFSLQTTTTTSKKPPSRTFHLTTKKCNRKFNEIKRVATRTRTKFGALWLSVRSPSGRWNGIFTSQSSRLITFKFSLERRGEESRQAINDLLGSDHKNDLREWREEI